MSKLELIRLAAREMKSSEPADLLKLAVESYWVGDEVSATAALVLAEEKNFERQVIRRRIN